MATIKPEVKKILEQFGLNPRESLWDCHGTWILLHKSCQVIQHRLGIIFDEPQIVEMNLDKKHVVIKIRGRLRGVADSGEVVDRWDFGEATPANNKNSYPVAMALKRAEDKIIIHLARLREHGIYSSEEADEFKEKVSNGDQRGFAMRIETLLNEATDAGQVNNIITGHKSELNELPVRARNKIRKTRDLNLTRLEGGTNGS